MHVKRQERWLKRDRTGVPSYVIGPRGTILTAGDLPSETSTRWVKRRKAEIFTAVHGGLLSLDDACLRYRISVEEFLSWRDMIEASRSSKSPAMAYRLVQVPERAAIDEKVELLLHQANCSAKK